MSTRIARGTATRRPVRSGGTRGKRPNRKSKKAGLLDGIPLSPRTARALAVWGGLGAFMIIALATLFAFRVPQRIGVALAEQVGAAGFAVKRVELRGLSHMDRATVYRAVLNQPSLAMPIVDLDAIRDQLLSFPWIKEARVSRRLPDTLVVEIVEREPAAVWQMNRRLQLIDAEGVALGPVDPQAMPSLPLLIGPGAQHQVTALGPLLEVAPQLRPQIVGSTWVGGRRWDLSFASGETLSLPEGDDQARAALQRFAQIAAPQHLFDGRFIRFDMRIEGRMIVQLRHAPEGGVPALAPAVPPAQSGQPRDLTRTI
jgi:cell division protein FtsQ